MKIEYIDISPLPFINTDLEINGTYPAVVEAFRKKILEADSILFASPEYNYSVSGISKPYSYIWDSLSYVCFVEHKIAVIEFWIYFDA